MSTYSTKIGPALFGGDKVLQANGFRSMVDNCGQGYSEDVLERGFPTKIGEGGAKFHTPMSLGGSTSDSPFSGAAPDVS